MLSSKGISFVVIIEQKGQFLGFFLMEVTVLDLPEKYSFVNIQK